MRNLENLVATRSQLGRYYNQKETCKYISICDIMHLGFSNKRHIKM
jgi:ribosomal protein S15P/S13E